MRSSSIKESFRERFHHYDLQVFIPFSILILFTIVRYLVYFEPTIYPTLDRATRIISFQNNVTQFPLIDQIVIVALGLTTLYFLFNEKKILPILLLVLVSYSSLWLPYTRLSERISFSVGALIAAMLFHRFLLNEIPPIGYLTTADISMITAYTLFSLTLITVIIHAHHKEYWKEDYTKEKAIKLDRKMRILTPLISAGVFLLLKLYSFLS